LLERDSCHMIDQRLPYPVIVYNLRGRIINTLTLAGSCGPRYYGGESALISDQDSRPYLGLSSQRRVTVVESVNPRLLYGKITPIHSHPN